MARSYEIIKEQNPAVGLIGKLCQPPENIFVEHGTDFKNLQKLEGKMFKQIIEQLLKIQFLKLLKKDLMA